MIEVKKPIRMCIVCKKRVYQKNLIRLQCSEGELKEFSHQGRSFYICQECLKKDDKKLLKPFLRYCKRDKNRVLKILREFKEKIFNG